MRAGFSPDMEIEIARAETMEQGEARYNMELSRIKFLQGDR